MGVWHGIAFFGALKIQISEPDIGENHSCRISGIFLEISTSEKYFPDSGKWPFHTPPIHATVPAEEIGAFSGLIGVFSGPIGTSSGPILRTPQPRKLTTARNCSEKAFFKTGRTQEKDRQKCGFPFFA